MKDQERSELAARVAEDLAQHEYTQLVNENGVEVWRCQQPGTRVYHFDICVTAYGMSMFGDIDGLLWHVGADYGITFLRPKRRVSARKTGEYLQARGHRL